MPDLEQNQFRDAQNRLWTIRVTAFLVREFKDNYGFDVRNIKDGKTLLWLTEDDAAPIIDLIALALADDLAAQNLTANDLFREMEGPHVEAATWAFIAGCIYFFPSAARKPLLAWMDKMKAASNLLAFSMTQKIEAIQLPEETTEEISQIIDRAFATNPN